MTDGILAAIDGALTDWATSDDAMRWSPDPPRVICDGGILWPARRNLPFPSPAGRSASVTFSADASQAVAALSRAAAQAMAAWKLSIEQLITSSGTSAGEVTLHSALAVRQHRDGRP